MTDISDINIPLAKWTCLKKDRERCKMCVCEILLRATKVSVAKMPPRVTAIRSMQVGRRR